MSRFSGDVRGVSGRIVTVVVRGDSGHATITGSQLRAAFGLPDDRVWFDKDRNILGAIRTEYDRMNCRPGLPTSQRLLLADGSRQRFENGGIYRNSTTDVSLWIRGSVYDEYRAVREVKGVLGLPTDDVVRLTPTSFSNGCARCKLWIFQGGRIYANPNAGTHALWGAVLTAYVDDGAAGGPLGYPTDRVRTAPEQQAPGRACEEAEEQRQRARHSSGVVRDAVLAQQIRDGDAAFRFLQDADDLGLIEFRLPHDRS